MRTDGRTDGRMASSERQEEGLPKLLDPVYTCDEKLWVLKNANEVETLVMLTDLCSVLGNSIRTR